MVKVLSPGFYSTIQDLGRFGFQDFGVPYSGAMDEKAARLANVLLGNNDCAAVLEQTMSGAELQFESKTCIAITGADMQPKLNSEPIEMNKIVAVSAGAVLSFGSLKQGFRSYIGVYGGFQTEVVMGSRSMYHAITSKIIIQKGDGLQIPILEQELPLQHAHVKVDSSYLDSEVIEVFKGPEFEFLTKQQQERLFDLTFHVSKNNSRMAYQLEELFSNTLEPILTSGVLPGTVQLTPSGNLIILMKDCQSTGGYPRVLQLKDESLSVLAQKYTGASIKFNLNN